MPLPNLRRVRWAVRATLVLGVSASVAANILNARQNPISQTISAWPPLALLLTIELISRVPMGRRALAAARLLATATIASIAAWVSYWHMVGVAHRYGESQTSAYLLPISVDGLVVVASVCLVELAGRIRQQEELSRPAAPAMPAMPPSAGPAASVPVGAAVAARRFEPPAPPHPQPPTLRPAGPVRTPQPPATPAPPPQTPDAQELAPSSPAPAGAGTARPATKTRRPVAETAALAAAIEAAHPDITQAELARQLGISPSRLRTIKRETRELERVA